MLLHHQCYAYDSHDHLWWYSRVAGTSTYGWMSDDNLRYSEPEADDDGDGYLEYAEC